MPLTRIAAADETRCDGCRGVFERVRELDEKAVKLLSDELAAHVRGNKFPMDLTDEPNRRERRRQPCSRRRSQQRAAATD